MCTPRDLPLPTPLPTPYPPPTHPLPIPYPSPTHPLPIPPWFAPQLTAPCANVVANPWPLLVNGSLLWLPLPHSSRTLGQHILRVGGAWSYQMTTPTTVHIAVPSAGEEALEPPANLSCTVLDAQTLSEVWYYTSSYMYISSCSYILYVFDQTDMYCLHVYISLPRRGVCQERGVPGEGVCQERGCTCM